jgi:hypothetical protein
MAHAQKAVLPKDVGGPRGKRLGVSVGGNMGWGLRVGAYVTGRASSTDWCTCGIWIAHSFLTHYPQTATASSCSTVRGHLAFHVLMLTVVDVDADKTNNNWNPQQIPTTISSCSLLILCHCI